MNVTDPADVIPVDDPRRRAITRAIFSTLWAAGLFSIGTGPVKQIKPVYNHAPWLNDPFDTAVSFAMFFVALIAVFCLVRVSLCPRAEPLPNLRVFDLLRGCRVVLAAIAVTLLAEWIALVTGANQAQWNVWTWLQVGLLVFITGLAAKASIDLRRASGPPQRQSRGEQPAPDWLTDMVLIAKRQTARLGPLQRPSHRMLNSVDRRFVSVVRRHPLWAAAILCAAFGAGVGINQGMLEGYDLPSTATAVILIGCGMFGLVVGAGSYLGLVRSEAHLVGIKRRVVNAFVLTCAAVLVPFALRDSLWWIVGSNSGQAGVPQLGALLGIFALLIFAVAAAVDLPARLHPGRKTMPADRNNPDGSDSTSRALGCS